MKDPNINASTQAEKSSIFYNTVSGVPENDPDLLKRRKKLQEQQNLKESEQAKDNQRLKNARLEQEAQKQRKLKEDQYKAAGLSVTYGLTAAILFAGFVFTGGALAAACGIAAVGFAVPGYKYWKTGARLYNELNGLNREQSPDSGLAKAQDQIKVPEKERGQGKGIEGKVQEHQQTRSNAQGQEQSGPDSQVPGSGPSRQQISTSQAEKLGWWGSLTQTIKRWAEKIGISGKSNQPSGQLSQEQSAQRQTGPKVPGSPSQNPGPSVTNHAWVPYQGGWMDGITGQTKPEQKVTVASSPIHINHDHFKRPEPGPEVKSFEQPKVYPSYLDQPGISGMEESKGEQPAQNPQEPSLGTELKDMNPNENIQGTHTSKKEDPNLNRQEPQIQSEVVKQEVPSRASQERSEPEQPRVLQEPAVDGVELKEMQKPQIQSGELNAIPNIRAVQVTKEKEKYKEYNNKKRKKNAVKDKANERMNYLFKHDKDSSVETQTKVIINNLKNQGVAPIQQNKSQQNSLQINNKQNFNRGR